jgi:serine/threonine-protein kinase haspin
MRTHMIEKTHTMRPSAWHDSSSLPPSITAPWEEFAPYTNVLWIRYILTYLLKTYQAPGLRPKERRALNHLTAEIKELQKRLNVKTKVANGAFTSAQEVLAFVVDAGWVTEEQLEKYGVDESTLGEVSKLIEDSDDSDDSEESDADDG